MSVKNTVLTQLYPIKWTSGMINSWGWVNRKRIKMFKELPIPFTLKSYYDLDNGFEEGVREGYKQIYKHYYNREDFLESPYTTLKLSIGLNRLQKSNYGFPNPNLDMTRVNVKILGLWVEFGRNKRTDNFIDVEYMKHEIYTGMIGPEVRSIWDQQPIRENVKVLYRLKGREDVWIWQRCLVKEEPKWYVYDINNMFDRYKV